jgi:hypothetical protein
MSQILIHFRIDLKGKLHREKKDLEKHFFVFVAPDLPLGYLAICGGEFKLHYCKHTVCRDL